MKTLIVAQGLERERILAAISLHSPNKLVILRSKKNVTEELDRFINDHIKTLERELFPPKGQLRYFPFLLDFDDSTKVDFFNLASSIAEIDAKIEEELEENNEVSVDISSGNKIVNIALFIVAQMYELRVTYCSAGKYASMHEEPIEQTAPEQIAFAVSKVYEIPHIPLKIKRIPMEILINLDEMKGKAESVTELAQKTHPNKKVGKQEIVETSRKLELLQEYGYIIRKRIGRKVTVEITEEGRRVIKLRPVFSKI